jgi:transcriptional regulator with XRE-family HTH domain
MVHRSASPIDHHVGARVRMRRMMLGLSQEKLGEALGITFQQIQKYEKGTNRISASKLQLISTLLQVPVAFFFEGLPLPQSETAEPAAAGPADGLSVAEIDSFLASRDGLALTRAFVRIDDPKIRRSIVALVEQIEEDGPH